MIGMTMPGNSTKLRTGTMIIASGGKGWQIGLLARLLRLAGRRRSGLLQ